METIKITTIDEYIADFPPQTKAYLNQIRETIQLAAPEAEESISYAMPAFKLKGKPLVYFAGYKGHIGFYATPNGHKAFEKDLSVYKQGKGSVQFPLDKPMPLDLIARITKFRAEETLKKLK